MFVLQISFVCSVLLVSVASQQDNLKLFVKNDDPPPHTKLALTARYVVHNSNWGVVGSISSHFSHSGTPFTNIWSLADGPVDKSTGIPYFYIVPTDVSVQDFNKNNSASLTLSEIGLDYCREHQYDPEDPRCARVTLMGKIVNVTNTDEKQFALNALFTRHPEMRDWSHAHPFYPVRMDIEMVWILDYFGPGHIVSVKDYFAANPLPY